MLPNDDVDDFILLQGHRCTHVSATGMGFSAASCPPNVDPIVTVAGDRELLNSPLNRDEPFQSSVLVAAGIGGSVLSRSAERREGEHYGWVQAAALRVRNRVQEEHRIDALR